VSRAIVAAGAAVAAAWCAPALAPVVPPAAALLGVPRLGSLGQAVALTFDDGPHPDGTAAVLEVLREEEAVASFFAVGEQVGRNPALLPEVASAGHEVALHGYRHRNLLRLSARQLYDDLDRGMAAIEEATGSPPLAYRPPYGIFSPVAPALVRGRGLRPLLWSKWGKDWARRATPASIAATVTDRLGPGDVMLLHDADHYSAEGSWRRTVAALPRVLEEVRRLGLATTTVSELAPP
jgi:peptidoglycan-N-acetylglucosamine deacetylase